jgi:beta-galactosidase GanA
LTQEEQAKVEKALNDFLEAIKEVVPDRPIPPTLRSIEEANF